MHRLLLPAPNLQSFTSMRPKSNASHKRQNFRLFPDPLDSSDSETDLLKVMDSIVPADPPESEEFDSLRGFRFELPKGINVSLAISPVDDSPVQSGPAPALPDLDGAPCARATLAHSTPSDSTFDAASLNANLSPPPYVRVLTGWRSTGSSGLTAAEEQALLADQVRDQRLEQKYEAALAGPPAGVIGLVLGGVPGRVRGRVWSHILDPNFASEAASRPSINSLIESHPHKSTEMMEMDLRRTYGEFAFLSAKLIGAAVYRILRAYAATDPELGYSVGMSFFAGILAAYMDEQRALWCLLKLLAGPGHETRMMYTAGFEGWIRLNLVWTKLIEERFKKVAEHLQALRVGAEGYTRGWFLTAFLELNIRPEIRLTVFDRFVAFGCRALLSFGLTIVALCVNRIKKGTQKQCIELLLKPPLPDWRATLAKYDKLFLSEKEYSGIF
jgi:hypothetical protein